MQADTTVMRFKLHIMSEYMSKHVEVKCLGLAINDMNLQAIRILWLPLYIKRFETLFKCLANLTYSLLVI